VPPVRPRHAIAALALVLPCLVAGCRGEARRYLAVRHLGAPDGFTHCAAAFNGETRPAAPCVRPVAVARAKDVRVPASGTLAVALDGTEIPKGPVHLAVEAYTYGDLTGDALARGTIDALDKIVSSRKSDRLLADGVGFLPAVRAVPQPSRYLRNLPKTVDLQVPPSEARRSLVYVVWAWPVAPMPQRRIAFEQVEVPPEAGLSIGFAVAEPGWAAGSSPVLFTVSTPKPGGDVILWNRQLDPAVRTGDRGWQEAEVDLGPFAGRKVTLHLTARIEQEPAIGSFPLWARPKLVAPEPKDVATPPSMLLVSFDTVRADHLSTYGAARETSPALTRLAADGVLFEQAMSHFPSTTASHMSMFTSMQPCAHGVTLPKQRLPAGVTTLAQALAEAGYTTGAVTEDALIKGDAGFDRGFDTYRDLLWAENEPAAFARGKHRVTGLFGQGLALATDWIARHDDRPFFFFLHTYQPHVPFKVPAHYATLFVAPPNASTFEQQAAEYDAGIRNMDDLFGSFLATLERRGLLERLVVVVTSDHGIEFGEHGGFGHARGVHDEQVHVPLVFRHPTLATGGRRIREPVPLLDIAPTLLNVAGVPAPPTFRGRSLLRALRGDPLPEGDHRAFAEQLWGPRQTLLRDGRWAWITTRAGTALYDMDADPRQQRDLAADEPERAAEGAARIQAFRKACTADNKALRADGKEAPLDPQRRRALELLGYAE
jgi:arylsulfatase A-like enzyme